MTAERHFPWLDWLRFLAALMVLTVHVRGAVLVEFGALPSSQKSLPVAFLFAVTRLGHEAVLVFFVLSGYFVAGRCLSRVASNSFSLSEYATDRFTRIYIPYVPALVLSWICALYINAQPSAAGFVINLLGLQGIFGSSFAGNAPLWSLAYEIWFYILAGAMAAFTSCRGSGSLRLFVSAILILFSCFAFTILSPTYLMCWLLGGAAYFYRPRQFSLRITAVAIASCSIAVIALQVRSASQSLDLSRWLSITPSQSVGELLLAAGMALLIPQLACIRPTSDLSAWWNRAGTRLAAWSYTLYLTHYPIIWVILSFSPKQNAISVGSLTQLLVTWCTCLLVAYLMYFAFEKHTTRIRRTLRNSALFANGRDCSEQFSAKQSAPIDLST